MKRGTVTEDVGGASCVGAHAGAMRVAPDGRARAAHQPAAAGRLHALPLPRQARA
jgi:hypothetical protein